MKQLFQRLQATFKIGTEQEKPNPYAPHGAVLTGNRDGGRCCAGEYFLNGLRTVSFVWHDHIRQLMVDPVAMECSFFPFIEYHGHYTPVVPGQATSVAIGQEIGAVTPRIK